VEKLNKDKSSAAQMYQKSLEEHKNKMTEAAAEDGGGKEKAMGNVFEGVRSMMTFKGFGTTLPLHPRALLIRE
jgi:TPP-dependent indolepyruvate ferredoxin oxidoreductase alpha subunit